MIQTPNPQSHIEDSNKDALMTQKPKDRGFSQRLETVAHFLEIKGSPDKFWQSWQDAITKDADSSMMPITAHITLMYLLVLARYPISREFEEIAHKWQHGSLQDTAHEIFSGLEYSQLCANEIEYRLINLGYQHLHVDITHTLFHPTLSGIQRVVISLCRELTQQRHGATFFIFRNDAPRPTLVTPEEIQFLLGSTKFAPAKAISNSWLSVQLKKTTILKRRITGRLKRIIYKDTPLPVYFDSDIRSPLLQKPHVLEVPIFNQRRVLLPELTGGDRNIFYLNIKKFSPQNWFLMIVYDFTPIWYPEYAIISSEFLDYLRLLRVVDKVSCISSDIERQARHMIACIREMDDKSIATHELPGAIEVEAHQANSTQLNGEGANPYILCVGTIEPRKNQHKLLNACLQLMKQGLQFRLVFVGNPGWGTKDFLSDLTAAQKAGFEIEIKYSVTEKELSELYSSCAFTVYCSHAEGFGLPIVESFRFGKAAVVSERGCMRDIANRIGGGLFIDPDRQETIEEAIRLLLSDKEALKKLEDSIHIESWPDWKDYANTIHSFCMND